MRIHAGMAALLAVTLLGACSGSQSLVPSAKSDTTEGAAPSFSQFSDIPIPAGASMNLDKTLLLGAGDAWIGRLVYTSRMSTSAVFDFYKQEMPGFGWSEVTSVRSMSSVMTYQRQDRVATIQIGDKGISSSEVALTVSPHGNAGNGGAGMGGLHPPAASAAPAPKVTRQPLK